MKKITPRAVICIAAVAVLFLLASPCRADVSFIHVHKATEYLMGKQGTDLLMGNTDQAMFIDKKIRYTGKMMTPLYGKFHEGRETTHFLLDKVEIREMDDHRGKIIVFPFDRLTDVN